MYPQNIPLNKLHLFALTEDKNKYNELNNYKFKTIFDLAKEKNVTINYDAFTSLNYDINYSEDYLLIKDVQGGAINVKENETVICKSCIKKETRLKGNYIII